MSSDSLVTVNPKRNFWVANGRLITDCDDQIMKKLLLTNEKVKTSEAYCLI